MFLILLSFLACGCHRGRFTLTGTITGSSPNDYLCLKEVIPGILKPVDSVIPDIDGNFSLRGETHWPAYYLLSFDNENFMTLLVSPGEKIIFNAEAKSLAKPVTVSGSEGTKIITDFMAEHESVLKELEYLNKIYEDSINSHRLPFIMDSLDRKAATIVSDFQKWALSYLDSNINSMASIYLLNQHIVPELPLFDPARDPGIFIKADSSLYSQYPESDVVLDLHTFVANLRNSASVGNKKEYKISIGDTVPEIALPNPAGDTISLSSTRGKVVLVDFWAAWCPPCREENPNLVKLYDMYHSSGFIIYQVSLDISMEEWTEAIKNDRLGRWLHVSDLKYRDSEVVKAFGLTGIPYNLLIDRDGKVIEANLRGAMLQEKLEDIFTQH